MPVFDDQGMAHSPMGMLLCGTNKPRAQAAGVSTSVVLSGPWALRLSATAQDAPEPPLKRRT